MGYTTWFFGEFKFREQVTQEFMDYIDAFSCTRHMLRDPEKIKEAYPDWEKRCFHGNLGKDAEYFLDPIPFEKDLGVINYNTVPDTQPGLWCQWFTNSYGDECVLEWNGSEKFYNYIEWLRYLIDNFIKPEGYHLDGEVEWIGEDESDTGKIVVENNEITVYERVTVYNKIG